MTENATLETFILDKLKYLGFNCVRETGLSYFKDDHFDPYIADENFILRSGISIEDSELEKAIKEYFESKGFVVSLKNGIWLQKGGKPTGWVSLTNFSGSLAGRSRIFITVFLEQNLF